MIYVTCYRFERHQYLSVRPRMHFANLCIGEWPEVAVQCHARAKLLIDALHFDLHLGLGKQRSKDLRPAISMQATVTKRSYPNNHLKREVYRKLLDSKGARILHKLQMHQTARHWLTGPSSLRISWIIECDHGWTLQKVGWWRLKNWGRMRRILTVAPCSWYVSPNLFQPPNPYVRF